MRFCYWFFLPQSCVCSTMLWRSMQTLSRFRWHHTPILESQMFYSVRTAGDEGQSVLVEASLRNMCRLIGLSKRIFIPQTWQLDRAWSGSGESPLSICQCWLLLVFSGQPESKPALWPFPEGKHQPAACSCGLITSQRPLSKCSYTPD